MDLADVKDIERPHYKLMRLYLLRSLVVPPFSLTALPFLFFRYHTLRYAFDDEGVTMRWGILFRREISLSYARIQDIHLTSGIIQRWLGLADIHIQTASGSAAAEMKIEGLLEFETVRDFLYSRMRGVRSNEDPAADGNEPDHTAHAGTSTGDLAEALREVAAELRATRDVLSKLGGGKD